jgi:hypothetical protein
VKSFISVDDSDGTRLLDGWWVCDLELFVKVAGAGCRASIRVLESDVASFFGIEN